MTQKDKELEIWKPIPNYEEYEVSTFGRVKRLAYDKPVCGGSFQHCNERILSPQLRKNGYQTVMLSKKGVIKSFLIHRLVAITFIPNPDNLQQVNHKDENPSNNCVNNLEWCDQKYNSNYGTSKSRIASKLKNGLLSKPVQQYSTDGIFVREYTSAMEASRKLGLNASGIISCCNCHPKYKTCGNYQWKYSNSDKEIVDIRTCIVQFTKEGEQICTYESITQASTSTGISRTSISNNLSNKSKSAGGFIWKKVQNNYS